MTIWAQTQGSQPIPPTGELQFSASVVCTQYCSPAGLFLEGLEYKLLVKHIEWHTGRCVDKVERSSGPVTSEELHPYSI